MIFIITYGPVSQSGIAERSKQVQTTCYCYGSLPALWQDILVTVLLSAYRDSTVIRTASDPKNANTVQDKLYWKYDCHHSHSFHLPFEIKRERQSIKFYFVGKQFLPKRVRKIYSKGNLGQQYPKH